MYPYICMGYILIIIEWEVIFRPLCILNALIPLEKTTLDPFVNYAEELFSNFSHIHYLQYNYIIPHFNKHQVIKVITRDLMTKQKNNKTLKYSLWNHMMSGQRTIFFL